MRPSSLGLLAIQKIIVPTLEWLKPYRKMNAVSSGHSRSCFQLPALYQEESFNAREIPQKTMNNE